MWMDSYKLVRLRTVLQAAGTLVIPPPLLRLVFQRSTRALHEWLELDFDAEARTEYTAAFDEYSELVRRAVIGPAVAT